MSDAGRMVVAFSTTGNSPKEGYRFSEILIASVDAGEPIKFSFGDEDDSKRTQTFAALLPEITATIGDAWVVVHDASQWRRFLRSELRGIKRHGAAHLLKNVVDISAWAHQRFPRQRKNLAAIARRVGLEVPASLDGLPLEVELLRGIAKVIPERGQVRLVEVASLIVPNGVGRQCWIERIGSFWRGLTGRA